jgi:hypothetical protein
VTRRSFDEALRIHEVVEVRLFLSAITLTPDHCIRDSGTCRGAEKGSDYCCRHIVATIRRRRGWCRLWDDRLGDAPSWSSWRSGRHRGSLGRCDFDRCSFGSRADATSASMALVDTSLPRNDPTVLDDGTIMHHIRLDLVYDLNAVTIEVHDSSIKLVVTTPGGRGSVGTGSRVQGCSIEVSNSRPCRSGECDVRGTGFYTIFHVSCCVPNTRPAILTLVFLGRERSQHPGSRIRFGVQTVQCTGSQVAVKQQRRTRLRLADVIPSNQCGKRAYFE